MKIKNTFAVILVVFCVWPRHAAGQDSRCGDCHLANADAVARGFNLLSAVNIGGAHLAEWDRSPHGRSGVGCHKCHGGDATTFESFRAHQGVLNSRNPSSPVNRRNLPQMCGSCHTGPFVEFQKSKHYELLRAGNDRGPTCSTCHTEVGAHLPSPKGLANDCAGCHAEGKEAPYPDHPVQGRLMLEDVRDVRAMLDEAKSMIRRVKDKTRRAAFEETYQQALVSVTHAVSAGHAFVFDNMTERLAEARRKSAQLLDELPNPPKR